MLALSEPAYRAVIGRLAHVPPPYRLPWFTVLADRLVELVLVTVEDVEAASGHKPLPSWKRFNPDAGGPHPCAPTRSTNRSPGGSGFLDAGRPASSGLAHAPDLPRVLDMPCPKKPHRRGSRSRDGPVRKGTGGEGRRQAVYKVPARRGPIRG